MNNTAPFAIPPFHLTLTLVVLFAWTSLSPIPAHALTGGPDSYGYTFTDSTEPGGPAFQWISITTTGQAVITQGDDASSGDITNGIGAAVSLGFPFTLYGTTVSQLVPTTNGYISTDPLEKGQDATNDCPLPATPSQGGGARFYVLHDDLTLTGGGDVYYQYFHKSPHPHAECGVSVFTWDQVIEKNSTSKVSFQALLFDNGDIIYQYNSNPAGSTDGLTIGIQRSNAATALTHTCSLSNQNTPASGLAILFSPPTITVTTNADELDTPATNGSGLVSLREALRDIPAGGQVLFDASLSGMTLELDTGHTDTTLDIDTAASIDASSLTDPFEIDGNFASTIMEIDGVPVTLQHLVIREGATTSAAEAGGITIINSGALKACHTDFFCNGPAPGTTTGFGAIYTTSGRVAVHHCRFRSNTANNGGAIRLSGTNAGPLEILHSEFACNRAILNPSNAFGIGGAVEATIGTSTLIENSSFFDNTSINGGGALRVFPSSGGALAVRQSTFSNNRSENSTGGAINISRALVSADFSHCTIVENRGANGGPAGIAPVGSGGIAMTMDHCVAANNRRHDGTTDNIATGGAFTSLGYNLVDDSEPLLNATGDIQNTDPKLGPLGPYGGNFTMTHLPLADSPLIDAGNPAIATPPATDQRKLPRIADGNNIGPTTIDIGAVEAGPFILVNTVTDENNNPATAGSGNISLREAFRDATSGQHIRFDPSLSGMEFELFPSGQGDLANLMNATSIHVDASNLAIRPSVDSAIDSIINLLTSATTTTLSLHNLHLFSGIDSFGGVVRTRGPVTFNTCRFSGNRATGSSGGGVIWSRGSHNTFHCSEFIDNSSNLGDGSVAKFVDPTYLRITDSWFHRNGTNNSKIGTIIANGSVIVDRSTFSENSEAGSGGGAINRQGDGCLIVRSSTFSGNSFRISGSAIYTSGLACPAEVTHSTFIGNRSANTAVEPAIFNISLNSPITLRFNLFAKNFANTKLIHLDPDASAFVSEGYNLADSNELPLDHPADLNILNPGLAHTDLRIGPLAWNGGKVPTHHPLVDSPAIDGDFQTPATFPFAPRLDTRGLDRSQKGDLFSALDRIDPGAVEVIPPILVTTSIDENTANATTSLREAIIAAPDPGRIIFNTPLAGNFIDLDATASGQNTQMVVTKTLLIDATNLTGPTSTDEGGITLAGPSASRIMTLGGTDKAYSFHGLSFTDGKVSGGAISATGVCLTITHAALHNNNTNGGGGALNLNNVNALFENVTFAENAAIGGGISGGAIIASNGTHLDFRHCTLFENEATAAGAGIALFGSTTTAEFYATIIGENRRTNNNLANIFLSGAPPVATNGYNLTDDPATYFTDGTDIVSTNPALNSLPGGVSFPGGLARTCPPAVGSLAVDNGPAAYTLPPCTDARGFPRIACGNLDIGAYELGAGLGNDFFDNDGLDNYWESFYGISIIGNQANEDPDNDGLTNLEEFLFQSKPNDANSAFRVTRLTKNEPANFAAINWNAAAGQTYDIYHSDDLNQSDPWSKIGTVTPYTASGSFSTKDPAILNARNAFFEIRLAP
ncbi:MAG: choice-of-anchor Q domain-containing protein [Verrucomicrobiota bacterium]